MSLVRLRPSRTPAILARVVPASRRQRRHQGHEQPRSPAQRAPVPALGLSGSCPQPRMNGVPSSMAVTSCRRRGSSCEPESDWSSRCCCPTGGCGWPSCAAMGGVCGTTHRPAAQPRHCCRRPHRFLTAAGARLPHRIFAKLLPATPSLATIPLPDPGVSGDPPHPPFAGERKGATAGSLRFPQEKAGVCKSRRLRAPGAG